MIGSMVAFCAAFFGATGDNLVKLSHRQEPPPAEWVQNNPNCVFAAGWFSSIVVNTGLTMLAYNFASVALVAPFGGVHIACNVVLAHFVNKEPLVGSDFLNVFVILVGLTGTFVPSVCHLGGGC
eukprot:SAG11_NODE_3387_length_2479_cov_4.557983_2_plen_124_part_00